MKRIVALIVLIVSLSALSGTLATEAKSLNPEQKTVASTVNIVYWDLVKFWGPRTNPGVNYYNNGYADYWAVCNPAAWTGNFHGSFGFACNNYIYLDLYQQAAKLQRFGDGAVAFWLAHEFGHHMESLLNINWTASRPYHELLADCFAGMYFRYGVYTSRKLNYNDYRYDARNQIWDLTWTPTTEPASSACGPSTSASRRRTTRAAPAAPAFLLRTSSHSRESPASAPGFRVVQASSRTASSGPVADS